MISPTRSIPAGLLDDDIEFFNHPQNPEKAYCLTGGGVHEIKDAPEWVKNLIRIDLNKYPKRVEALVSLGYETDGQLLTKYISCCFGAFDGQPDAINGVLLHSEYWPCPHRGACPVEGLLCDGLLVGDGQALTRREIDVLSYTGRCLLDKEIADRLGISEETVKVHKKHIYEKTGLQNKMDLVKLAFDKNLIL